MEISYGRLTDVPAADLLRVLNDPRLARHMPLWGEFTRDGALDWAASKTAVLDGHGVGPQAVYVAGVFAGWAGIQFEDYCPDLAIVLSPDAWGVGLAVARDILAQADAHGLEQVFIALPPSRRADAVVARMGFAKVADDVDGFAVFTRNRPGKAPRDLGLT